MARGLSVYDEAKQQDMLWDPRCQPGLYLGFWLGGYEYFDVDANGRVREWTDISGNGNHAVNDADVGDRPLFNPPKGCCLVPSIGDDSANNGAYLQVTKTSEDCYGLVCMFEYGFATFQALTWILSGGAATNSSTPRCAGNVGSDRIRGDQFRAGWKNGTIGAATNQISILPMQTGDVFSCEAFTPPQTSNTNWQLVGSSRKNAGSIRGRVSGYALFGRQPTEYEYQITEAHMVWNACHCGGRLKAEHPFRNRPPMRGDL